MRRISQTGSTSVDVARMLSLIEQMGERRPLRDPIATLCESLDLTGPQTHALMRLGKGPLPMGELALRTGISDKTLTGVIDRLERDAYLKRERDEGDRRVVRVRLTRKGSLITRRLRAHLARHIGELLEFLTAAERQDLFRLLERVRDHLAAPRAARPA